MDHKEIARQTLNEMNDGMDRGHNSLYDRGKADSYYGRGITPHYYFAGMRITDLTKEQIAEYTAGYNYNTALGDFKDWG